MLQKLTKIVKFGDETFEITLSWFNDDDHVAGVSVNGWSSAVLVRQEKRYDVNYLKPFIKEAIEKYKEHLSLSRQSLNDIDTFKSWDGDLNDYANVNEERISEDDK